MDSEPRPVVLTERQRRVLWLMSTGLTRPAIAKEMGCQPSTVMSLCNRTLRKLDASNGMHAVRIGLLDGHIGPYDDCGSLAAYRRHIKNDENTCAACKRGNHERMETDALLRSQAGQLAEPHIRLLRAMHAGRTNLQIRQNWRIDERTLERLIASTYTLLGVAHLPTPVRRETALKKAAERGLLAVGPAAPAEAGRPAVRLSQTQIDIFLELETGASINQAAERLGIRPGTCSSRLSEAYQRLDVAWMDKDQRRPRAIRKARELGLLPEPATT